MAITIKPGTRLFSAACATEAIVVRAPGGDVDLRIGGHPALLDAAGRTGDVAVAAGADGGSLMGKRYVDESGELEVLCTKPGAGSIAVGETALTVKDAKPLPASD